MPDKMICIDASVLVARSLSQDAFYDPSRQFVRKVFVQKVIRCAPALVLSECSGPVARRTESLQMGKEVGAFVERFFADGLIPVSVALGRRASEIAAEKRIRGADAVYVATAEAHDAVLVTWDREMLDRGSVVVDTLTPREWLEAADTVP